MRPKEKYDFIIYDFETNSLNKKLGQILQSAAIRYDDNFAIQETHHENSKLLPYMIPGPKALEITRISPKSLSDPSRITELELAKRLRYFFVKEQQKGVKRVYTGYNTFSFDEEVLRSTLFRNLMEPYITSQPNAYKLDLYPTLQYMHYVMPGIIIPGKKPNGKESWKLSDVTQANGFNNDDAHDAVADTKMTMELLKILVEEGRPVFDEVLPLSKKRYVADLFHKNDTEDNYVLQFTHFGEPDIVPLAPVAGPKQAQRTMCIDLSKDPLDWVDKSAQEIAENVFVGGSPFHMVAPTKAPMVFDKDNSLLAKKIKAINYKNNQTLFKKRALIVRQPDVVKKLNMAMDILDKQAKIKFAHRNFSTEQKMYDGFVSDEERNTLKRFLEPDRSWKQKAEIIKKFQDKRIIELTNRMLATYGEESFQTIESLEALKEQFELRFKDDTVEDIEEDLLTFNVAYAELEQVEDKRLKRQIKKYLTDLEKQFKDKIKDLEYQILLKKSELKEDDTDGKDYETAEQLNFLL